MKPKRFHNLKRPKLRQTWNKFNLYNMVRARYPKIGQTDRETFFQQKWRAKGLLRTYHGEHIVERKWTRMFSRRLLGVTNMDTRYMARHDGAELAEGRGSGKDTKPNWNAEHVPKRTLTPYMQMTFAPMERRLDIAVFRAMFASSARQARQFCVHGAVKVNGKMVPYPAYRLNPGDMFQVDPERVMYATGRTKTPHHINQSKAHESTPRKGQEPDLSSTETETETVAPEIEQDPDTTDAPEADPEVMKAAKNLSKEHIRQAASRVKELLKDEKFWGVAEKQRLREFLKGTKQMLAQAGRPSTSAQEITDELSSMVAELKLDSGESSGTQTRSFDDPINSLSESEFEELNRRMEQHIREERENPIDPSKPYVTPWKPRPYMAPFAYIPKYLEVNQNICAAVYLRHPVAKNGFAEVPTPYPNEVSQLAFNWYLRRR
ncbi:alpha-L RNA-binding motif-containing protein [Xylariaceae sp. FL0016]|nr:alpha-L RNA-binding motif-containing protein [Xylariaceae sp. FL0016]